MKLALASAALRDAPLEELAAAAARRGFAGVVLEEGDGHGVAEAHAAGTVLAALARVGLHIAGYRLSGTNAVPTAGTAAGWGALAATLEVPLIVPVATPAGAAAAARVWAAHAPGAEVMVEVPGWPAEVLEAGARVEDAAAGAVGLAWRFTPDVAAPLRSGAALRELAGSVRHVRLHGGGPETQTQGGAGIGTLMAQLALSAFDGTVSVAPGNPRYRTAWAFWLGRHGGTGCGSRTEDRTLVLAPGR